MINFPISPNGLIRTRNSSLTSNSPVRNERIGSLSPAALAPITSVSAQVNPIDHTAKSYIKWLSRLARITDAYNAGWIPSKNLSKFQMLLLETGQFNANFTLDELSKLNYPLSPFAVTERHTYIQATDTWAMEMLCLLYQKEHPDLKLCPIWIDSCLFWTRLNRYCRVVKSNKIDIELPTIIKHIVSSTREFDAEIWIELVESQLGNIYELKKQIDQVILQLIAKEKNIDDVLIPIFISSHNNEQEIAVSPDVENEVTRALEVLFPRVIKQAKERFENDKKLLVQKDYATNFEQMVKVAFRIAKKYKVDFPDQAIKKPNQLVEYASTHIEEFKCFVDELNFKFIFEAPAVGVYITVIRDWLNKHIEPIVKEVSKKTAYFFSDWFAETEAIVFCGCSRAPEFVNSMISNLGYRVDPVRIIRTILHRFPNLFFDKNDTERFWDLFKRTSIGKNLPESIKDSLIDGVTSGNELRLNASLHQDELVIRLTRLKTPSSNLKGGFLIYHNYLLNFLDQYLSIPKNNIYLRVIFDLEVLRAIDSYLHAWSKNDLATAVRYTQEIAEISILILEHQPLAVLLPEKVKNQLLAKYPVQKVIVTPYAIRAFVHTLQILDNPNLVGSCNISVTNQSYFEWLHNLDRLESSKAKVKLIRHLDEIDSTADIIFAELHPNNVVESKQSAHNLNLLLDKMYQADWCTKQRSLVIDITLNALNDREVTQILDRSSPLVKSGWLNIILIQSLTEFSQLGFDKRSAGLIAVINNRKHWALVNQKLEKLGQAEHIDNSTLNFFSYFANLEALLKGYIEQINRNVRFVYTNTLQQLNQLEVSKRSRFQITMSSDPKACYVAINMHGLLSELEQDFALKLEEIEKFAADVISKLVHPLCELFKLPLTERTSIGLPLTSVSIVFDSLRLTIGLEPDTQLYQYSSILAYTAFVLNRQSDPNLFFDKDQQSGKYELRLAYFKEKVSQFEVMTPGFLSSDL
jgi:hypothetical protein